jgi:CRISPR/Cas system endoribonuclease Cas6 (RAMP superfamily)
MGCVGRASYVVVNRDRYWTSLLNLLTEYSFYSGVGYQTTIGLGQARPPLDTSDQSSRQTDKNSQSHL